MEKLFLDKDNDLNAFKIGTIGYIQHKQAIRECKLIGWDVGVETNHTELSQESDVRYIWLVAGYEDSVCYGKGCRIVSSEGEYVIYATIDAAQHRSGFHIGDIIDNYEFINAKEIHEQFSSLVKFYVRHQSLLATAATIDGNNVIKEVKVDFALKKGEDNVLGIEIHNHEKLYPTTEEAEKAWKPFEVIRLKS